MMKRFLGFILFSMSMGLVSAQDMPPLPPLPDQSQAANSNSNSSIPVTAPSQPATNAAPALPPLPATQTAPASPAAPAAPAAPAMPASGDQSQAPAAPAAPAASPDSTETPSAEAVTQAVTPGKKHHPSIKPWKASQYRPNVIFGGWVKAKGGNESSRLAWTSQEVLNALLFKKYRLVSPEEGKQEEGSYDGQGGHQWRQFNFNAPKSKLLVQVYVRQSGKKVWLRVGPGEAVPPAAYSLAQAQKIRAADLAALHLIQRKFGHRLSPNRVVSSWEAPYRYSVESADR